MFIGRKNDLRALTDLKRTEKSAFVVCSGRRRIGKSTLIEEFGKQFLSFYEFQGLHPKEASKESQQLDHFSEVLGTFFKTPKMVFSSWTSAFSELSRLIPEKPTLLFLDEISWMSTGSETFSAELKSAWDILFKRKPGLILVIAGSVSSWIEENILNNSNFLGRVSLNIHLEELSLTVLKEFWGVRKNQVSTYDFIKTACVFGGVPLYLDSINPSESPEQNIHRMCFQKSGFLVDEFDKIFSDIFLRRGKIYKTIVTSLLDNPLTFTSIIDTLDIEKSGSISKYLKDLVVSGFLDEDITYDFKGVPTKFVKYRVRDNYIRFALKYIEPNKKKIKDGLYRFSSLDQLPSWPAVVGLQFENLILSNKILILDYLRIDPNSVISCSPYFQRKSSKNKGGCQIDLMIVTKNYQIYLCEIKMQEKVGAKVLDEIQYKIDVLKRPRHYTVHPALIYCGEITSKVRESGRDLKLISVEELLE